MPTIIVIAVIALGALLFSVARLLRSGKDSSSLLGDGSEDGSFLLSDLDGEESEEIVDLVDYFSGPETDVPAGTPAVEMEFDKLCDVKVGQSYLDECQQRLNEAKEKGALWAVLSVDIDRFRFINSLRGVSLGDYALTHLARELEEVLPDNVIVTRKSADHLFACFPIHEQADLEGYCDRLRRGGDRIREAIGVKSGMRLSIGVALTSSCGYDIDLLLAKANIARTCMKSTKNENYGVFDDTMLTSFLYGESALDDYGDNQFGDELTLFFQPQSDLNKNLIVAAQALTRWTCEAATSKDLYITPENGKIPTNGSKVLYMGCRELNRWRKAGKETLSILIYLPTPDFYKADIDELFVKCFSDFQLEPSLIVPVVESSAIRINPEIAKIQLQKLSDLGMKIAVDSITAVAPNFTFLSGMPIAYLKVPRGLTTAVERKPDREQMIRQLHAAATALKIVPIYEGVDDITRMKAIKNLGGLLAEGRYAGRSVLSDDFSRILQEYVQKRKAYDSTVILDDDEFHKGDYHV